MAELRYSIGDLPFQHAVNNSMISGVTRVASLGHNPSIASGTAADVWEGNTALLNLQQSAVSLEVISTSANDTSAGTGLRTVTIIGLNASYVQQTQTVTLNGTTAVAVPGTWLAVNTFTGSGTPGTFNNNNAGDIILRIASAGAQISVMKAGIGFARTCLFTVPAGFTLMIESAVMNVLNPAGAAADTAIFGFCQVSSAGLLRIPITFQVTAATPYRHVFRAGFGIPEKTAFFIRCTRANQNGTDVTAGFEGFLIGKAP